jgi:CubicO group peptidase (beta-lactamase class C family)
MQMQPPHRRATLTLWAAVALVAVTARADEPRLPGIDAAMQGLIAAGEIAGAVTVVVKPDGIVHLEPHGFADLATQHPMATDTVFWIASMTKPVTGVAVAMLIDDGLLDIDDPVDRYVPEFKDLKTPAGRPARITIRQILTHTSGLGEAAPEAARKARSLAELVPAWLAAPMKNEPGEKWAYTQSGINLAARIVEVVSRRPFDAFLRERVFEPLGMSDTTFFPPEPQRSRLATPYARQRGSGRLERVPHRLDFAAPPPPPLGNGGLYSTARDYAAFCRMLLNSGAVEGRRLLGAEGMRALTTVHTGELPTGFLQGETFGSRGGNYGWGLGICVLKQPHDGVAAMLSPGTFGHGGAWGTQAWIDPVKQVAYVLMVQRTNFTNSDGSDVRRVFQEAAAAAIPQR